MIAKKRAGHEHPGQDRNCSPNVELGTETTQRTWKSTALITVTVIADAPTLPPADDAAKAELSMCCEKVARADLPKVVE